MKGPMVDVDLPEGECEELPEVDPLFAVAMSANQFGTLLALHASAKHKKERGSLDFVSIGEYVAEWVKLGARVGRYQNNEIIWE